MNTYIIVERDHRKRRNRPFKAAISRAKAQQKKKDEITAKRRADARAAYDRETARLLNSTNNRELSGFQCASGEGICSQGDNLAPVHSTGSPEGP